MSKHSNNSRSGTAKPKSGYRSDMKTAYGKGYVKGWDDAYDIPKRFGAKTAAAYGYKKGIKQRYKTDKYTKQYQRKGKQN